MPAFQVAAAANFAYWGPAGLLALLALIQATSLSRTIRSRSSEPGMSVIDHDQPHMAIGVIIDGVHWVADAGYGGKGLRLPIRNDLIHTSADGHHVVGMGAALANLHSACTCCSHVVGRNWNNVVSVVGLFVS